MWKWAARGRSALALGVFALAALSPAVARADGGLEAVEFVLWFFLATSLGLALGFWTFIAALRSPSRLRLAVAIAVAAVNGVMGGVVLAYYMEAPTTLCVFPSVQVALTVIGIPILIAWKRAPRHWLLSWMLGYLAVAVVASIVLIPLQWGLLSDDRNNRALEVDIVLLLDGLAKGVLLGFVQWLLLRPTLKVGTVWIGLTVLASAAAFYVGQQLHNSGHLDNPVWAMLVRGALMGIAQWPLLRTRLRGSWRWVWVSVLASLLDWPRAAVYVELPGLTWTVGLVMTALEALATGSALAWLSARRPLVPSSG